VRIWCLKALDDGTVVSGDSCGNIQFWDMLSGVLLQTFEHNPNNADVLDIAVTDDQCKIMASGVDCRVVCIERISSVWHTAQKNDRKWILTSPQRSHTHDGASLAIVFDLVYAFACYQLNMSILSYRLHHYRVIVDEVVYQKYPSPRK
jgi:WD40 repeat protein